MIRTRDAFIAAMQDQYGIARATAEQRWPAYAAANGIATIELAPEDSTALEKETQRAVTDLFRAFGGVVRSTSQSRPSKIAVGMADLWVCFPLRALALWWETKRPVGGKLSPAQQQFAEDCAACGIVWGSGSRADAEAWLIERGWAERNASGGLDAVRAIEPTDESQNLRNREMATAPGALG